MSKELVIGGYDLTSDFSYNSTSIDVTSIVMDGYIGYIYFIFHELARGTLGR